MKTNALEQIPIALALTFLSLSSHAQGTFVYDQQSSDESQLGGGATSIQSSQPVGQSFTPTLSSVGFIRLYLSDDAFNGLGATIYVNMRQIQSRARFWVPAFQFLSLTVLSARRILSFRLPYQLLPK